ncbi:uncharacterized protein SCHCODRAFT_02625162 [Schizophyllum commune H4-8]|uniref:uncharacterized protein n=1 Tax=Schizophyllum commune (strain H4-8 / FGSC 9210) TaxID=578458 RepID=UPI00215FE968|nr:uncharacterized protein SCHCODRAFT_02625162 [Schizophyllum commune H4-8]KAI5892055.1 hypothetical protein SCHCODRAFT_02625162 [Schizophyllum commune H4-8]
MYQNIRHRQRAAKLPSDADAEQVLQHFGADVGGLAEGCGSEELLRDARQGNREEPSASIEPLRRARTNGERCLCWSWLRRRRAVVIDVDKDGRSRKRRTTRVRKGSVESRCDGSRYGHVLLGLLLAFVGDKPCSREVE